MNTRFRFCPVWIILLSAIAFGQVVSQPGSGSGGGNAQVLSCNDTSGSGTAQSCTTNPSFVPSDGDTIIYETTTANTGDLTINVNSSGAVHARKWQGTSTLAANDLRANVPMLITYNASGPYWEFYTIGNAPSGGSTNTQPAWFPYGAMWGAGGFSVTTNTVYVFLLDSPVARQITKCGTELNSNVVKFGCAIYAVSGGAPLASGTGILGGNGSAGYAPLSFTTAAGSSYYLAITVDGNSNFQVIAGASATDLNPGTGSITSPLCGTAANAASWSGTTITWPSPLGSVTHGAFCFPWVALTY